VKWSAALVTLVPLVPVTVTSTVPGVNDLGAVAVMVDGETTVTPLAAASPKLTVSPAAKFVPEIVTGVAAAPLAAKMTPTSVETAAGASLQLGP